MANRFDTPQKQEYVSQYVPMPLDYLSGLAKEYNVNQEKKLQEGIDIAGKNWNFLPSDYEYSKKAKKEIENAVAEFGDKDFSDPIIKREWSKKKNELVSRLSPTGDLGAIQANYDAYKAYEKNILDKAKDLGWSQNELRSHLNQAKESFAGTVQDGNINYFAGEGVANYVDANEWASKALKDVAADTGISKLKNYGSLNEVTQAFASGEIEHKDYNKIMSSLLSRAAGDEKLKSSLEQEGRFKGQKGWSDFIARDENGKPLVDESGTLIPNTKTPFGNILQGIAYGAQYQKEKQDYMKVSDPLKLYNLKKRSDEEDINKQMLWTSQGIPTDPKNVNNDSGINTVLKNTDNNLGNDWEFKDGKLSLKNLTGKTVDVVNINGKQYGLDNLPEGYKAETTSGIYMPGAGSSGGKSSTVVKGPDGKNVTITSKPVTEQDHVNANKNLIKLGQRLGVSSGKFADYKNAVEEYLKTANTFQMNFTAFDEGTKQALSKAFGASVDKDGNVVNPGQLSFSTVKTLDGKPLEAEDLELVKANILNNSKILGPAKSLTNSNYKAGDLYLQSKDPKTGEPRIFIINTNNVDFNRANQASTSLTQSINNFIQQGVVDNSPLLTKVNKAVGATGNQKFVSAQQDSKGNVYASFVKGNKKDANGRPIIEFGVTMFNTNGQPIPMTLDEANKLLDKDNISPLLPTYNTRNFDRATKTDEFENLQETE
jgi:hypothetical protein